jgi:hypothetical protein
MRILLLFIISLTSSHFIIGQTSNEVSIMVNYEVLKQQFNYKTSVFVQKMGNRQVFFPNTKEKNTSLFTQTSTIPSAYSYNDLAIFCKLEVQLEQRTKIPIKFRLGEFNHIEKLEGKPYSPFLVR